MAPNLIGSTFLLAEASISSDDANISKSTTTNNTNIISSKTTKAAAALATASPAPIPVSKGGNDRVPSQDDTDREISMNTIMADSQIAMQAPKDSYKVEIVWKNVVAFIVLHSMTLYSIWLIFAERAFMELGVFMITTFLGGMGITAGVHRLWSHRAYKARLPLRIFLMLCQSLAFQNSIWEWARDHRVHHKFTDTNADPHNSRRGFFFAHMGWLMCKKHPDVREKGKKVDMSDLEADPVVMFQKKYYYILMPVCCFIVPALFPYFVLGSSLRVCFFVCSILRYTLSLHGTWLVNSAAHFYGMKPYDINISSMESKFVASIAFGEGWHNYHHVFPWDYKAAELGTYQYNWTTAFINTMAKIGQAYDLKSVSTEMVLKRIQRTGDGSHSTMKDCSNNSAQISNEMVARLDHNDEERLVWGWDDEDISNSDRTSANVLEKKCD